MPPRYAYWTIIIDNAPTAFRAREREELLPTFRQLARRNPTATIKWFTRGRLWESPEEARAAVAPPPRESRGRDWRPGGRHEDPRARFKKSKAEKDQRATSPGAGHHKPTEPPPSDARSFRPKGPATGERRPGDHRAGGHGNDRRPDAKTAGPKTWGSPRERRPHGETKWESRPGERPRGAGSDRRPSGAPDSRGENRGPRPGQRQAHGRPDNRPPGGSGRPDNRPPGGSARPDRRPPSGSVRPEKRPQGAKPWSPPAKGGERNRKWGGNREGQGPRRYDKKGNRGAGPGTGAPTEPEPPVPTPPQPPGPDRPPRPGQEPRPDTPGGETIKILPEPPERAGK